MVIKEGDKVKVEYTGKFEDGTIFDSSKNHDAPLEFEIGAKQVVAGFEECVRGLKKGETKEIKLASDKAYGPYNPELLKKLPADKFKEVKGIKEGMVLGIQLSNGFQVPARIVSVNEKEVAIDLNHPLAGKTIIFIIKLLEVIKKKQ